MRGEQTPAQVCADMVISATDALAAHREQRNEGGNDSVQSWDESEAPHPDKSPRLSG